MQIIPIYDAAANADQSFKDDVQAAIAILDAAFSAPITVRIDVEKGEFQGQPMSFYGVTQNTSLGGINDALASTIAYSALRTDLINAVPGLFDATNLPDVASIQGHSVFAISSAEERVFGILPATNTTDLFDGSIGIGTGFSPGAVRISAVLHEIGHALGRVSDVIGGAPDILSLWRFTGVGTHLFTDQIPSAPAYFSLDGGTTDLANWGQTSDPSDFLNNSVTGDDPFNEYVGNFANLTSLDKLAMEALGFQDHASYISPVTVQNDYLGIMRVALPLAQATTIANAIDAGTQTEAQYVNGLISQVANTTIPALVVESSMYGAVGTSSEVTALATQFLPAQVAFAQQYGLNPQIVATEALGLVFAFGNESGSTAFANQFGPSNSVMPNSAAGDAAFAAAAASAIFGSGSTANLAGAITGYVANWKAFYTSADILPGISHPSAAQIDLAARGAAWGDAVGVALASNIGPLGAQAINFLEDAAQGTAAYSAPLSAQPQPGAFQGEIASASGLNNSSAQVVGITSQIDHSMT